MHDYMIFDMIIFISYHVIISYDMIEDDDDDGADGHPSHPSRTSALFYRPVLLESTQVFKS